MRKILVAFARNTVFANIILVLIFVAGFISVNNMIREFFPESSLDLISVSIPYPGADPEEVEEGISRKIEEEIEGLEGVKQYTTKSSENLGIAAIEVKKGYDVTEVLGRIKTRIDAISTFPVDAEKPVVKEVVLTHPVASIKIAGDLSERRLKEWAEGLKDELQTDPEISTVNIFGARDYEIGIELSEEKIREYGISLDDVATAVKKSSITLAGGTVRTREEEVRLRTMGRKYTDRELSDIIVMTGPTGEIVTLDRIAVIRDDFKEDPVKIISGDEPALLLVVSKTKEEDSISISGAVKSFVKRKQKELPESSKISVLYDNSEMLQARIDLLTRNGMLGLMIVVFVLWAFLNARLAFWGGMGIPISIAGALGLMWAVGETINMISLFGLIMVLGIVVDDAIVVGEAIFVHRKSGKPPLQAAVDGVVEVGMPVFAAVVTTIVAFMPLYFIGGVMGKFISVLPVVVIACLVVSLVECLFLLPAHLSHLPEPGGNLEKKGGVASIIGSFHRKTSQGMELFVEKVYAPFLSFSLRHRYLSLCVAVSVLLISLGFVFGGILKFEVLPKIDGFVVMSTVEFPSGTPASVTEQAVRELDQALVRLDEMIETTSGESMLIDRIAMTGGTMGEMPEYGPHYGAIQAVLLESDKRGVHSSDILAMWEKQVGKIAGVTSLTFEGMSAGPPGAPIEIWIQGSDMGEILAAVADLKEKLEKFQGVYQVRSDFSPGKNELRINLKPHARSLGLTVEDLARQVQSGFFGREAFRLQRGRDDIRVKVRYSEERRANISDIERIRIRTHSGNDVPLLSVADVSLNPGFSTITRTDGSRRVSVSAEVNSNLGNANEILSELSRGYLRDLSLHHGDLLISVQGEKKKMRESFTSLKVGFPIALMGIFIIIATMFRSYVQPLLIMFTIPFGLIGSLTGHLVMGYDLSMMSVFGMVALTGVVVNDAIVLIERINENLAREIPFFDAIIRGGCRRFRAIFLTTVSTVGGLAPLLMETDLQARFLIPMAISIAAGVTFATILTLVLIPSLFVILSDMRLGVAYLRHGKWFPRLSLEPAILRYVDLSSPGQQGEVFNCSENLENGEIPKIVCGKENVLGGIDR